MKEKTVIISHERFLTRFYYDSDTNTIDFGIPSGQELTFTDTDDDGDIVVIFS